MENQSNKIEKDLIVELKHGNKKAFNEIYHMYSKRLFAYSIQFTKSTVDAEEIVQDVFIKLWQNRESIKQEETLHSLLFIMSKNLLINAYRSRMNDPAFEEYVNHLEVQSYNNIQTKLQYDDFVAELRKKIKKLPLTQQKVFTLSRLRQFSIKEIAEKLSLSEQTVKNQLSIALKTLRKELNVLQ